MTLQTKLDFCAQVAQLEYFGQPRARACIIVARAAAKHWAWTRAQRKAFARKLMSEERKDLVAG